MQSSITNTKGRTFMRLFVNVPTRPEKLAGVRGGRLHNRYAKEAMRETLQEHHKQNIPKHFKQSARDTYKYAPRAPAYKRYKLRRYKSARDLVLTGATEKAWTTGQGYQALRVGGSAEGDRALTGSLTYRWSWTDKVREHMKKKYANAKIGKNASDAEKRTKRFVRARIQSSLDTLRQSKRGVTLQQMNIEAQTITPEESKLLAAFYLAAYWRRVEATPSPKRRAGQMTAMQAMAN